MAQSKKRRRCPNGMRKSSITGKCIPKEKQMTKKNKKRSRCPNGMRKNSLTGNCESKTKKKIIRLPKSMKRKIVVNLKKQNPKKKTKRKKRCPNGQRRNINTGECQIIKKSTSKKKEVKEEVIEDNTPSINRQMKDRVSLFGQYSPSINKQLMSLQSLSPLEVQGCKDIDIKVRLKNGKDKCYKWNSKKAINVMLSNLRSKKPIDCSNITAPKQLKSNCWFNSFFMTFFISDYGRKFNRWLREAMITGKLADGNTVNKKLRKPLFALNKYINASLRTAYDNSNFANLMDTNNIIKMIYSAVGRRINYQANTTLVAPVNKASNPIYFYKALYRELGGDLMKWLIISVPSGKKNINGIKNQITKYDNEPFAKVIYLQIYDSESQEFHKPKKFTIIHKEEGKKYKCTYTLDAAVLRNTERYHFSAYITCNGKDYGFDGESFSRMERFNWKSKLNSSHSTSSGKWRFAKNYNTYFSFTKGYQILFYYLTSIKLV